MSMNSQDPKRHLPVEYVLWNRENVWFWRLLNAHKECVATGAAPDSAKAMEDARSSIEVLLEKSQG